MKNLFLENACIELLNLLYWLKIHLLLHAWIYCLHECIVHHICARCPQRPEKSLYSLGLELKMLGSEPGSSSRAAMPFTMEASFQTHETVSKKRERKKERQKTDVQVERVRKETEGVERCGLMSHIKGLCLEFLTARC